MFHQNKPFFSTKKHIFLSSGQRFARICTLTSKICPYSQLVNMIYLSKRGMNTMKNRFIIAVLSTTLLLSGCACANNKEKKDEKAVNKD